MKSDKTMNYENVHLTLSDKTQNQYGFQWPNSELLCSVLASNYNWQQVCVALHN